MFICFTWSNEHLWKVMCNIFKFAKACSCIPCNRCSAHIQVVPQIAVRIKKNVVASSARVVQFTCSTHELFTCFATIDINLKTGVAALLTCVWAHICSWNEILIISHLSCNSHYSMFSPRSQTRAHLLGGKFHILVRHML